MYPSKHICKFQIVEADIDGIIKLWTYPTVPARIHQLVSGLAHYIIWCQTHYIDPSNSIGVRPRIASGRLVWPSRLGQ